MQISICVKIKEVLFQQQHRNAQFIFCLDHFIYSKPPRWNRWSNTPGRCHRVKTKVFSFMLQKYFKHGKNVKFCCTKTLRHTNIQAHGFRVPLNDCQIVTDVTFCLAYASRWVYKPTEFLLESTWWFQNSVLLIRWYTFSLGMISVVDSKRVEGLSKWKFKNIRVEKAIKVLENLRNQKPKIWSITTRLFQNPMKVVSIF